MDQIGCLDFNLLLGTLFITSCIGKPTNLLIFYRILTVARFFQAASRGMFERTGSHCRLVERTRPIIIRIVLFSWVSTFFVCTFLSQTGEQYSVTLYTKAKANVWKTFARQPKIIFANLLIILTLFFNLFLTSYNNHTNTYIKTQDGIDSYWKAYLSIFIFYFLFKFLFSKFLTI